MGRRSKKASNNADKRVTNRELFSKVQKRDIKILTDQLLQKATELPSPSDEWENYVAINDLLTRIMTIQKGYSLERSQRAEKFEDFYSWLSDNGVSLSNVEIDNFPDVDFGLKATKDLKCGDLIFDIPRKVMMTSKNAATSYLAPLVGEDQILLCMPNVSLALFLLCEARLPSSFWSPYIDIFPHSFTTVMYNSPEELKLLKGSPVFSTAINQCRSIARQYAYFFNLFLHSKLTENLPIKDCFTYEDYRWAVSAVMTRQNPVPSEDGSETCLGLIPLWDMCNHRCGKVSGDFNLDTQRGECFSMSDFNVGDQIFICYGNRSSMDFFLHNGFVCPENDSDYTTIKLGVSRNDPHYTPKIDLLSRIGLKSPAMYKVLGYGHALHRQLMAFLRIFVADNDSLDQIRVDEEAIEHLHSEESVKFVNDKPCYEFLLNRLTLLLAAYPTLPQDTLVASSANTRQIISLLNNEKRILQYSLDILHEKLDKGEC